MEENVVLIIDSGSCDWSRTQLLIYISLSFHRGDVLNSRHFQLGLVKGGRLLYVICPNVGLKAKAVFNFPD